jgi:serine/threonine-protein kinase RsbW
MRTETFPGRFESLPRISEYVTHAARQAGLKEDQVYAVDLAVDEACTNIIEHAYGGEGNGEIRCSYIVNHDGLTIVLSDQGRPFKPKKVIKPKVTGDLKDVRPGGAGIYLIHKMMDEVRYEASKTGNTLTLVKKKTN